MIVFQQWHISPPISFPFRFFVKQTLSLPLYLSCARIRKVFISNPFRPSRSQSKQAASAAWWRYWIDRIHSSGEFVQHPTSGALAILLANFIRSDCCKLSTSCRANRKRPRKTSPFLPPRLCPLFPRPIPM